MADDWEDRRRSSNDRLNRLDDHADFIKTQTDRSNEVFNGIRDHDEARVRRALDVPPAGSSSAEETDEPVTLEDLFRRHRASLLAELRYSNFLHPSLTADWIARLRALDIARPLEIMEVTRELREPIVKALDAAEPQRDVFNLRVDEGMRHIEERQRITDELHVLAEIGQRAFGEAVSQALRSTLPRLKL